MIDYNLWTLVAGISCYKFRILLTISPLLHYAIEGEGAIVNKTRIRLTVQFFLYRGGGGFVTRYQGGGEDLVARSQI